MGTIDSLVGFARVVLFLGGRRFVARITSAAISLSCCRHYRGFGFGCALELRAHAQWHLLLIFYAEPTPNTH
jgi:hypothetical protein